MSESAAEALPTTVRALLKRLAEERRHPDLDAALDDVVRRQSDLSRAMIEGWHIILIKGDRMLELA